MSLFFLGNNFCKNKKTFKIFSPQLLEVYRILLVETTLESIMFYYTFSVINTMFVPCTALLYGSTAASQTLKLSTTIEHFLWNPSDFSSDDVLSCLWIVFSNSAFQVPPRKQSGRLRSWEQYGLELSVLREMSLSHGKTSHAADVSRVKPITSSHPIPKLSTHLTIF